MTVSDNQPVSAANLKAAVDLILGGGYFPRILLVGQQLHKFKIQAPDFDRWKTLDVVIGSEHVTYSARIPATVGTHTLPKVEGSSSSSDTVPVAISYDKQTQIVTIDDQSMVPFISIILNYL